MRHFAITFRRSVRVLAAVTGLVIVAATPSVRAADALVQVQVDQPGAVGSSNLFGIFFEEINYGGDGGVYAEMIRNRTFYNATSPLFWSLVTNGVAGGSMSVDTSRPLNSNQPNALRLTKISGPGSLGAANSGYWGLALKSGAVYDLGFYASVSNGFAGTIAARLESADGSAVYAQTSFSGLTTNWQKFSSSLVSSGTDTNARIVLSVTNSGTAWFNVVSLFPRATFKGRTNGLRADVAGLLADAKPSFFRFPGGNFIESFNIANAVRWKKSIGDLAQRPGHDNDSWGYWSTDGFGAHEFFLFCEDLGMEPLYGINAGLMLGYNGAANNTVPLADMGPWVQDALDLIEYANGPTNSTWGAVRAANGHPVPFNLKYLEVGNENGGTLYDQRYTLFYDAIKAVYPNMKLIASGNWSGGPPTSRPRDLSDEHYYSSPATFISYATKYDNYSRTGPKVFVGEYAVTSGYGSYGNLSAALGEAAFMTGMERNADIVELACYAPLFANVNGIQWHPDLIYYDNARCFGTPSYYVQKLFSENRGEVILPASVTILSNPPVTVPRGAIGLGAWNTSVQYSNVVVRGGGGVLYQSDFIANGTNGWRVFSGAWSTNAGVYQQTSTATDCRSTTGSTNWSNYTLSLRARKLSGAEGFLILFNWADDNNWTWWNVGGWGNTLDGIEQMSGGSKTLLGQVSQTPIAANVWYDISIVLSNYTVRCYLNGVLTQTATYSSGAAAGLFTSATYQKASGQVILKTVNPYSTPLSTTFSLTGVNSIAPGASLIQLTSASAADENSLTSPTKVFPTTNIIASSGTNFTLTLPANSLSVLRLAAAGINNYTNLLLQFPSPLTNGVTVASSVFAQQSGGWTYLTANANHALAWFSANTNIAVVDAAGRVTGVGPGTTTITAVYAALGLSASQTVQVIYEPVALVHRYSFGESSGTNCADSIGGPVWNGTLPNGGTWLGGQLTLTTNATKILSQYVQLPPGILSNYAAVTIETWVTFPDQLPVNCFFYGFGNFIGGTGYNYIFCAPRAGRAAIAGGNFSGEQNAFTGVDFSFQTNFHLAFVYNPPAGYLAIYTNGVLAAANNALTVGFNSVSNLYSWIGRSLYSGDPYLDFTLDEFRIYNGALGAGEIAATQLLGPDQPLSTDRPVVAAAFNAGGLVLSWPAASAGYTVMSSTNLTQGNWTPIGITPQLIGNQWKLNLPVSENARFYKLAR